MPDQPTGPFASPTVADLLLADADDFVGRPVAGLGLTLDGLAGDRHTGRTRSADARTPWHRRGTRIANTRQISLVSIEECAEIARMLGIDRINPALLGPNVVLRGIEAFSLTAPATRLQFPSGATLFVTEQNTPCRHPGDRIARAHQAPHLASGFARAATGRRGILALVERPGPVLAGDPVRIIPARIVRPHLTPLIG